MSEDQSHAPTGTDADQAAQTEAKPAERSVDTSTPGGMLYQGRLDQQCSVEQLCAQTKLTPPTVTALESNDFQALPQSVFVRGYYRQCAKALGLDADRIAAAYTAMAGDVQSQQIDNARQAAQQAVTPGSVATDSSGGRSYGLYFLFAILIAIVVALLVIPVPKADKQDGDSEQAQASQSESAPDEQDASTDRQDSADNSEQSSHDEQGDDEASGGRNVNQSLGLSAAERAGQDDDDDEAATDVSANKLVLKFSGDSWVSVTDADGKRLVYGLHEADDEKEVAGKPPYKVTLGAASNVKARMGGRDVDIKRHTVKGGTARFTLKEDRDDQD